MDIKLKQIRAIVKKHGIPQSTLYRWKNAKSGDWRNNLLITLVEGLRKKELSLAK